MLSILKFSGKHWSRSALGWLLLAIVVHGLAKAGAEASDAKFAAYNAAVALGVQKAAEPRGTQGQYQVAKVALKDLDLRSIDPAAFADGEDAAPPAH